MRDKHLIKEIDIMDNRYTEALKTEQQGDREVKLLK